MALNIVRLIGLTTLAILGASFGPGPANALSVEAHNFVRHDHAARHGMIAKRQTPANRRRCKPRTSTLSASSSTGTSVAVSTSRSSSAAQGAPTTTRRPPSSSSKPASTPKPTTSSKPPPPNPTKPPSNSGARKVGIAYNRDISVPTFAKGSDAALVYNWSPYKDEQMMAQIPGLIFVPMFWSDKQSGDMHRVKSGYSKYILGMNEPNQSGQANMSPERGAALWRQYIQPLKSQGYTLISPAPTNADSGVTWLQNFLKACSGCTVDKIATHWYGTDPEAFIKHLEKYSAIFGRRLWVTEFACQDFSGRNNQCSPGQVSSFMRRTTTYMNNDSQTEAYFWFGALDRVGMNNVNLANQLVNADSTPNALGRQYLGLTP